MKIDAAFWFATVGLVVALVPGGVSAQTEPDRNPAANPPAPQGAVSAAALPPEQLFEQTCSACHSIALPKSQRLDRSTWEWVIDDMVNEFGCTWITEEQRAVITDYLVAHYGPDRPR